MFKSWALDGVIVTGDLVESKMKSGASFQQQVEWQEYSRMWRMLADGAGIPRASLYDTRGNHDVFDVLRGGPQDMFCTYSASAWRANVSLDPQRPMRRVNLDPLWPASADGSAAAAEGAGAAAEARSRALLHAADRLRSALSGADGAEASAALGLACPSVVLVGIDAAPDPGLRSPTNFFGVVSQELLQDLDQQLAAWRQAMRQSGCAPTYIAYGHYPLGIMAYARRWHDRQVPAGAGAATGAGGARAAGSGAVGGRARARGRLEAVLARHGVSTYLCGHLHDLFGRRLHRLHASPACHQQGGASANSGIDVGCGQLLELEAGDWKFSRSMRIMVADAAAGGAVTFADVRMHVAPVSAGSSADELRVAGTDAAAVEPLRVQVLSNDGSRVVGSYLPLMTSPPDLRYGPQFVSGAVAGGVQQGTCGAPLLVRVVVLPLRQGELLHPSTVTPRSDALLGHDRPLQGAGAATAPGTQSGSSNSAGSEAGVTVSVRWHCRHSGRDAEYAAPMHERRHGASGDNALDGWLDLELMSSIRGRSLYEGHLDPPVAGADFGAGSCAPGAVLYLQAVVSEPGGGVSTSEERAVCWPQPQHQAQHQAQHRQGGSPAGSQIHTMPLGLTMVEWVVVTMPWEDIGCTVFLVMWVAVMVLLLAARFAGSAPHAGHQDGATTSGAGSGLSAGMPCGTVAVCAVDSGVAANVTSIAMGGSRGAGGGSGLRSRSSSSSSLVSGGKRCVKDSDAGAVPAPAALHYDSHNPLSYDTGGKAPAMFASLPGSGDGSPVAGRGEQQQQQLLTRRKPPPCPGSSSNSVASEQRSIAVLQPPASPLTSFSAAKQHVAGGALAAGSGVGRMAAAVLWYVVRLPSQPWRDLRTVAQHRALWLPLLAYMAYLPVGPWLLGAVMTPHPEAAALAASAGATGAAPGNGGVTLGLLTVHGIYYHHGHLQQPRDSGEAGSAGWRLAASGDMALASNALLLFSILPLMLWAVSVAARWLHAASACCTTGSSSRTYSGGISAPRGGGGSLLSWRQAVMLPPLVCVHGLLAWKFSAGFGWLSMASSPAVGWTLPLLALWLGAVRCALADP